VDFALDEFDGLVLLGKGCLGFSLHSFLEAWLGREGKGGRPIFPVVNQGLALASGETILLRCSPTHILVFSIVYSLFC